MKKAAKSGCIEWEKKPGYTDVLAGHACLYVCVRSVAIIGQGTHLEQTEIKMFISNLGKSALYRSIYKE